MSTPDEESGGGSTQNLSCGQPTVITLPVNIPLPIGFKRWKSPYQVARFSRVSSNYEIEAQLKDPGNPDWNKEQRTTTLLTCIGSDALDVIDAMEFENEAQRKVPEVVLKKMENYCIGECNETYERYVFNRRDQESSETIDAIYHSTEKTGSIDRLAHLQ